MIMTGNNTWLTLCSSARRLMSLTRGCFWPQIANLSAKTAAHRGSDPQGERIEEIRVRSAESLPKSVWRWQGWGLAGRVRARDLARRAPDRLSRLALIGPVRWPNHRSRCGPRDADRPRSSRGGLADANARRVTSVAGPRPRTARRYSEIALDMADTLGTRGPTSSGRALQRARGSAAVLRKCKVPDAW